MKKIDLFSRIQEFDNGNMLRLKNDFILINPSGRGKYNYSNLDYLKCPNKLETLSVTLITEGEVSFYLDLKKWHMTAPCIVVYFPDQILQYGVRDSSYNARYIHFSVEFAHKISQSFHDFPAFHHKLRNNPVLSVSSEKMNEYIGAFDKAQSIVQDCTNQYRENMIIHWGALLFYEILLQTMVVSNQVYKSSREALVSHFMELVRDNHIVHRELAFYAEKLSLTPKYLTTLIKRESGISASDWIERYVILHAQAMLKSTDFTIQQISDKLNFSSQVFFGKYFKRIVGISPSEYRRT